MKRQTAQRRGAISTPQQLPTLMAAAVWGRIPRASTSKSIHSQELPTSRSFYGGAATRPIFAICHFKSELQLGVVAVAWICGMQPLDMCLQELEFFTDPHCHSQTRNALLRTWHLLMELCSLSLQGPRTSPPKSCSHFFVAVAVDCCFNVVLFVWATAFSSGSSSNWWAVTLQNQVSVTKGGPSCTHAWHGINCEISCGQKDALYFCK